MVINGYTITREKEDETDVILAKKGKITLRLSPTYSDEELKMALSDPEYNQQKKFIKDNEG